MYSEKIESILKKKSISYGDRIEVTRGKKTFEGILIPRPGTGNSDDSSIIILKLKSGYNQGIACDDKTVIEKTGEGRKLEIFPSIEIKEQKGLPTISLIATGGTISSRLSYETGGVKWLMEPGQIMSIAPELEKIVRIKQIDRPFMVGSENMDPTHWQKMAESAAKLLNDKENKGIVITHGTDTLHYTAAALSFMLKDLNKPVVLTYAQKSTDRPSTDTALNLICSAYAAGHGNFAEVMLCGHGAPDDSYCILNRGTKVRKMHTSMRHTFRPINDLPIAKIDATGKIEIINENHKKRNNKKVEADTKFEEKVAILKYYPGANPIIMDLLVKEGYCGFVVEATGLGHVGTDESRFNWLAAMKNAVESGVTVCASAQTLYGRLNPYVYGEARKLIDAGVIHTQDMLPETAYVKLGWVLGHTKDQKKAREQMETNIAGELTEKTDPRTFLY